MKAPHEPQGPSKSVARAPRGLVAEDRERMSEPAQAAAAFQGPHPIRGLAPRGMAAHEIVALHRSIGNRALQALIGGASREAAADRNVHPSTPSVPAQAAIQRKVLVSGGGARLASRGDDASVETMRSAAEDGLRTPASALPHLERIQRSFGRHDVRGLRAHLGAHAADSAEAMNAAAYAVGNHLVLGESRDLHTVAHEAAHAIQQRAGARPARGVGKAGDPHERHADEVAREVVRGRSSEALLDGYVAARRGPTGGDGGGKNIQRVVKIAGLAIRPATQPNLLEKCAKEWKGRPNEEKLKDKLTAMMKERERIYEFKSIGGVKDSIPLLLAGAPAPGMNIEAISSNDLKAGHRRRMRERVSRATEPYTFQVTSEVPGMKNVPLAELPPLDHRKKQEQQHRWLRSDDGLHAVKKRGTREAETEVTAFGHPENPSLVSYRDRRQLAHRYRGVANGPYAKNHGKSKDRTYGSKKKLTGKVYKISGMVDGHGIQAQNDQRTLGDAPDYESADRHPHNMYWENPAYGKWVRQKGFEDAAFKNRSSFLHVNQYDDYDNPTTERGSDGADYIVPDRVHNLIEGKPGEYKHAEFNNKRLANYGDFKHRTANSDYKVESKWKSSLNSSIKGSKGGTPAEHLAVNTHRDPAGLPDLKKFPGAGVIVDTDDAEMDFSPDWRHTVSGYESPDSSPYHVARFLETETETLPGHYFVGESLVNGWTVERATYDKTSKKTKITKSRQTP